MLLHIPQVLDAAGVETLRARLAAAPWTDGRATAGAQGAQVKRNRQLPEHDPLTRELGQIVLDALARNPVFFAAALPQRVVPPLFNSYSDGGHYGLHVDGAVRSLADGTLARTDVSATLFLSEPDTYDGGELIVADTYGEHAVKLPAGDLVLYPGTSLHCVAPVTRGARVCAFFWTQSMVRDAQRRAMLYELDRAVQALRARVGDCAEVLTLTGQYHNLLRQWAET